MATLAFRHVTHRFGSELVLDDVSLEIAEGEFLVLLGPSGCGKSTLLRIAAGLVEPTAGEVWIDGARADELEPKERGVALVFQSYALYPHMTVRENLAFPLKMARVPIRERDQRVAHAAEALGLAALLERKPDALSGGQMQRVALGRALVREPRLFLFDEPLSNLDAQLRGEMRAEIARLVRALGTTTLYVTHDQAEAMTLATRLCVLRAGRIEQLGGPMDVYRAPATSFVASFVGSPPMNLLRARVAGGRVRLGPLELDARAAGACEEIVLGIRPQEIELGHGAALPVRHVEHLGAETHVRLALGDQELVAVAAGERGSSASDTLAVELPPRALHWFDARSGARLDAVRAPASPSSP